MGLVCENDSLASFDFRFGYAIAPFSVRSGCAFQHCSGTLSGGSEHSTRAVVERYAEGRTLFDCGPPGLRSGLARAVMREDAVFVNKPG